MRPLDSKRMELLGTVKTGYNASCFARCYDAGVRSLGSWWPNKHIAELIGPLSPLLSSIYVRNVKCLLNTVHPYYLIVHLNFPLVYLDDEFVWWPVSFLALDPHLPAQRTNDSPLPLRQIAVVVIILTT